ncbi:hypothetical protein [Alkaliphilus sp. B6464]|uniref:hypothetical protein n=1 Tax=Alkaliphilus sp. B6464 TaxID=2731219 RepID=UPI001BAD0DFA|nr:hypothetical protein [Alkaliphilus sp. B6464]QUH18695.1 hypothetical protein HYG84_01410 [Alkaliphilus sp. B6464]
MMNITNGIKEVLEVLKSQTVEAIEEFRQEWIISLNVDETFKELHVAMINNVCDRAKQKATA